MQKRTVKELEVVRVRAFSPQASNQPISPMLPPDAAVLVAAP